MKQKPFTDETRKKIMEIVEDYRIGRVNMAEAQRMMVKEGGFYPVIARIFLSKMKVETINSIRGKPEPSKKKQ